MRHSDRLMYLDLARGLSAIAVCAGHLRSALFVDFSDLPSSNLLQKCFYFATSLGHEAVMVFFVLSGFFVGGSVLRNSATFRWRNYATARLTRLWIVLIPALCFTFTTDQLVALRAPEILHGQYSAMWASGPEPGKYSADVLSFAGNIMFLQTVLVPVFGTNTPLWSLANEFWYYVLFPLLALSLLHGSALGARTRLVSFSAAAVIAALLPTSLLIGFAVWLLGVFVHVWRARFSSSFSRIHISAGVGVMIGALLVSVSSVLAQHPFTKDFIVGAAFAFFCITSMTDGASKIPAPAFVTRFARGLSEFSYSLYVSHFPAVVLIATLYGRDQLHPSFVGLVQYVLWLASLLLLGVVLWWLFEKRTAALRGLVSKKSALQPDVRADIPAS